MRENRIKIGVIADDFTGASDAASFIAKSGTKTVMLNEVPTSFTYDCEAVVVALKTRSVEPQEAISQTKKAIDFLEKINCEKIYFKYCSTFDSTHKGNIGIVADYLMEFLNIPYTLLCPSLPVNGRTVNNGILYVNGVKLEESPLKNHPLNPMWDSYIPNLMKEQSKYPCFVVTREDLCSNDWKKQIEKYKKEYHKFYLIPDYENEEDGQLIANKFKQIKLITGGSGLLEYLSTNHGNKETPKEGNLKKHQKVIMLCGSCSTATKKQVHYYQLHDGVSYAINADEILNGTLTKQKVLAFLKNENSPVLIYSDAVNQDMDILKKKDNFEIASKTIEQFMSEISVELIKEGYTRIIVAGGETSGAVTKSLGYDGFYIGKSVDPGVPELVPLKNKDVTLVLKSGNFGAENFFMKAAGVENDE